MADGKKEQYVGLRAIKSQRRKDFVEGVVRILSNKKIARNMNPKAGEDEYNRRVYNQLIDDLPRLFRDEYPNKDAKWIKRKTEKSLIWEKGDNGVVSHTAMFGLQHRPDLIILNHDYRIAVEYKLVNQGYKIRDALGQGLVYASDYEFTICVLLDTTDDKRIVAAYKKGALENVLLKKLWDDYGIKMIVVTP